MQDVVVERAESNRLVVRWDATDRPERLVISPSADEPHALDGVTVELDGDQAVIPLEEHHPSRVYVHLFAEQGRHVVAAERLVPLEGTKNFRDIGGYPTGDGGRVRWGRVYRSDGLALLSEGDLTMLADLGVQLVCDFRGPHEEADSPSRIVEGGGIRRLAVPIGDGSSGPKSLWDQIKDGEVTSLGVEEMSAYYILTFDRFAAVYGAVLEQLADPANHAVVFHCTAGKDRTGMLAALLLTVLGVDEGTILHDYDLTNGYRHDRRAVIRVELEKLGVAMDDFVPLFTACPEVLATALAELRRVHGSIEAYLTGPAGVSPDTLAALRQQLVAPAAPE